MASICLLSTLVTHGKCHDAAKFQEALLALSIEELRALGLDRHIRGLSYGDT
jgi:hypothetical protein